jgi:predicted RNA-binding protein associated with RNAse of E/G family
MRTINVVFEDKEYDQLKELKGEGNIQITYITYIGQ